MGEIVSFQITIRGRVQGVGFRYFARQRAEAHGISGFVRNLPDGSAEITVWLDAARGGDRQALDRVLGTLYQELHTLARRQLSGQHNHTLDPTSLVHESYLKLIGASGGARFEDRAHFFAYAASAMRSVVVDYARNRMARKRGGDLKRVAEIPEEAESSLRLDENLLALDAALERLLAVDPKLAKVVEMRYFAGLSEQEIADLMQLSLIHISEPTRPY